MADQEWKTAITNIGPGKIKVRGYDITQIMDKLSFAEAVFLILKGELPNKAEAEMMRAILVSSIDHGCSPPSVLGTRTILSGGNSLNAAIAGGVLVIGDSHGGAIENAARIMQEWAAKEGDVKTLADQLVDWSREQKFRMPGFGHRLHNIDPRTLKLFEIAAKQKFSGRHIELCKAIEKSLAEKLGKPLPINVDGAIAAVISDMGFDWRLGKGFFIISRVPGLLAHAYEEMTREKPMRQLGNRNFVYDGPPDREI
ncbi:MAG: citryl-CoA lyase [candidate division Zixibacteria bacterium HGW-Zixibacteria-1]|nr:MAG: citryl-CoA lyase [candidate division Zixibacteria bacterium HGW-Zixibacteria-1]